MKRFLPSALVLLLIASGALALTRSLPNVVNARLGYSQNYDLDLNSLGIDKVSLQATLTAASPSAVTFKDGRVSTGTITVTQNTALTALPATNQITVAVDASLLATPATNYLTVLSTTGLTGAYLTFTDDHGHAAKLRNGVDWFSTNTTTGTAASILTALNHLGPLVSTRTSLSSVVYATATKSGAGGNAYKLVSSTPTAISVHALNFSGGQYDPLANAIITLNGIPLKQSYQWAEQSTATGTAASIAFIINHIPGLAATAVDRVVYATATASGTVGNDFTLETTVPSLLTVTSANFAGGRNGAKVYVGGIPLEAGVDWTPGATSALTAKAISNALMANPVISSVITSTWAANGVVYATSTAVGTNDFALSATPGASLTVSGLAMVLGDPAAYSLSPDSATIAAPSHGLPTGAQVLYTTSSATGITNLTPRTTYFIVAVDANHIKLASSLNNATAGHYVFLGSSHTTTTEHTFVLTPLALSGSAGLEWQVSNDGATWSDLGISSVTFSTPFTTSTRNWQIDPIHYHYLRMKYTTPTAGEVDVSLSLNGSGLGK